MSEVASSQLEQRIITLKKRYNASVPRHNNLDFNVKRDVAHRFPMVRLLNVAHMFCENDPDIAKVRADEAEEAIKEWEEFLKAQGV